MSTRQNHLNRRQMLKTSAVAGAGFWIARSGIFAQGQSPNEKLNVAVVGIGGQGRYSIDNLKAENIVGLCDVDEKRAGNAWELFPSAKRYQDFRKMYDEMDKQIDAVVVATPDHTHYHPAVAAIRMKKHIYCEKPLAHSPAECRIITTEAEKMGVASQIGAQRHAYPNMHRVTELIKSGAIGTVKESHAWIGGDRGMPETPKDFPEVPATLNWEQWIGPAKMRPYSPSYCPYHWRFFRDFGTGETGNWSCHILDIPYSALDLAYPIHVAAEGPEVDATRTPKSMHCTFQYAARGDLPPVTLHWYHTTAAPVIEKYELQKKYVNTLTKKEFGFPSSAGALFVGEKGLLLAGFDNHVLLPTDKFADFKYPEKFVPDSHGFHREWINACKGGTAASCNFNYSGPMAETAILGNAAYYAGCKSFDWDAKNMLAINCPEMEPLIKPEFFNGWKY
ncbi:MAG: Gfo/Idh/MocA family oxidoreductase [Planctomycetaceae bacterium]|jgi:predicted dehydrogenase|nr:Gfo/Idh/MocA family oxidoreductase [Planctomycetaceae bacterium]